jgi:hypothetical protein
MIETSARRCDEKRDSEAVRSAKENAGEIVFELLWNATEESYEDGWIDTANEIIRAAMKYTKARAGSALCPVFACEWWVDNKVVPPDMAHLVDGSTPRRPDGSIANQVIKPGPSSALLARDAELWDEDDDEDDEDEDDDSEGGDDE